jgi:hypothetical protein
VFSIFYGGGFVRGANTVLLVVVTVVVVVVDFVNFIDFVSLLALDFFFLVGFFFFFASEFNRGVRAIKASLAYLSPLSIYSNFESASTIAIV